MIRRTVRRSGFTLVELMVAAAVCVLIMTILATVFQLSIDTMRQLKSVSDMADQLRAAAEVVKKDLRAEHYLAEDGKPGQGLRLSDQRLDQLYVNKVGATYYVDGWTPPRAGFFRIRGDAIGGSTVDEGSDQDLLKSSRATTHYLHFTSILTGATEDERYTASIGGAAFSSRAAELAYFLDPTPMGFTSGPGSTPLYHLVRRQRLAARTSADLATLTNSDPGLISVHQQANPPGPPVNVINTLADLTHFANRLGASQTANPSSATGLDSSFAPLSTRPGDDILLSNVISFEVQVGGVTNKNPSGQLAIVTNPNPWPRAFTPGTATDSPFDFLPAVPYTAASGPNAQRGNSTLQGQYVFDTWSSSIAGWNNLDPTSGRLGGPNVIPLLIRVQALQIKIRIWEPKLKNARQITIVQDM